ncbi:MAG TPA: cytochrome c [Gemmatimonadaceae bacterium]|nr:cytochrome c [Gemmatimonadaceae bacterium]
MVKLGDSLFNNSRCAKCHGARGTGGDDGPRLDTGHWQQISGSLADIIKVTTDGAPGGAGIDMPPRGGTGFSDDQIKAVAAYVWTLSHH